MCLSAEVCSGQARDRRQHTNSFLKYPVHAGMISRLSGFMARRCREKSLRERHRRSGIKHNSRNVADISCISKNGVYRVQLLLAMLSMPPSLPKFQCWADVHLWGARPANSWLFSNLKPPNQMGFFFFWRHPQAFLGAESLPLNSLLSQVLPVVPTWVPTFQKVAWNAASRGLPGP